MLSLPTSSIENPHIQSLSNTTGFSGYPDGTISLHKLYRDADKSLARPGTKQARKHVREARDLKNMETQAVITFFFLQGQAPKEIHANLTDTLDCFLPGRAKDLSAPL